MKTLKLLLLLLIFVTPPSLHTRCLGEWQRPGTTEAEEYGRADAEINKVYNEVMGRLDAQQQGRLRQIERTWLRGRDAEAERIARLSGAVGGSAYRVDYLNALTRLTRERTLFLRNYRDDGRTNWNNGLVAVANPSTSPAVVTPTPLVNNRNNFATPYPQSGTNYSNPNLQQRVLTPAQQAELRRQQEQQEQAAKGICAVCGGGIATMMFVIVAVFALNISMLIWVARDAKSRGMDSAILWMFLVMFTSFIGLTIYLFSRPQGELI